MKNLLLMLLLLCLKQISAQILTTVAGNGTTGFSGDGGQATAASINNAWGVTADAFGNLYIADGFNNRIRKINTSGIISTVVGIGTAGYSGDGGQANNAELNNPYGVTFDAAGNMYITDNANNRIRKVDTLGIITTVAGDGSNGFTGDGGQAILAGISSPKGVAVDAAGNIYIADYGNFCIRKVDTSGIISTIAGHGGYSGFSGDGGQATVARFSGPQSVALDAAGNIFVSDGGNNRIRMVNIPTGIISTIAGNGTGAYNGDGGPATSASIYFPADVAFDAAGNLYIVDNANNAIRKVNTSGIITTVAGCVLGGCVGPLATSAYLGGPNAITFDTVGNYYIADRVNARICKVDTCSSLAAVSFSLTPNSPHVWDAYPTYSTNVANAKWYWGDSTSSIGLYPSHTYTASGWYNICVTVYNPCGDTSGTCQNDSIYRMLSSSSMVTVNVINGSMGINQNINKNRTVSIYPNPTSDQFIIEANSTDKINVDLYDVNGRHVFSANVSDKSNINVAALDNGAYTLTIKTTDRILNKKLVIVH